MSAFADAAAKVSQGTPAGGSQVMGQQQAGSQLFSGGQSLPSLFTKEHGENAVRAGVISKAPYDRQSRFMDEDENGRPISGDLKWWGEDNKPSKDATGPGGVARRPVMDTIIPLTTQYAGEKGQDDKGDRAWYVSGGPALNAMREAIDSCGATSPEDLVGMTLTVTRLPKVRRAWQYKATLTR